MDEDRYEAIELIVRSRADGVSWFDVISDLISADCQGSETEPCTCGLESMGGSGGTLEQCYRHQGIADDLVEVRKEDVLFVLKELAFFARPTTQLKEVTDRLHKECTWWEDYLATLTDELEED